MDLQCYKAVVFVKHIQTVMGLARAALFLMAVLALGFAQSVGPDLSDLRILDDTLLSDCGCF